MSLVGSNNRTTITSPSTAYIKQFSLPLLSSPAVLDIFLLVSNFWEVCLAYLNLSFSCGFSYFALPVPPVIAFPHLCSIHHFITYHRQLYVPITLGGKRNENMHLIKKCALLTKWSRSHSQQHHPIFFTRDHGSIGMGLTHACYEGKV